MPMDVPDVSKMAQVEPAMRRRLCELEEHQRWVHHAVDLERGEIVTTSRERPITPLLRAGRLSELGHLVDPTVFGGPSYRLTPSRPYQPSPEAWIEAAYPTYYAPAGEVIWWEPPPDLDPRKFLGMTFDFLVAPHGRMLASLSLSGYSFDGTVGYLVLQATGTQASVSVPVDSTFGAHTVDFLFGPYEEPREPEILMMLQPGIKLLRFNAISFASAPPVVEGSP